VAGYQLVPMTQIQASLEDKGLPCTFHWPAKESGNRSWLAVIAALCRQEQQLQSLWHFLLWLQVSPV